MSSAKWRPSCLGLNVLNGLALVTWTNAGLLSIRPQENITMKFHLKIKGFHLKNAFEYVVWNIAVILSRSQCTKWKAT